MINSLIIVARAVGLMAVITGALLWLGAELLELARDKTNDPLDARIKEKFPTYGQEIERMKALQEEALKNDV